jgi:threonine aldolase
VRVVDLRSDTLTLPAPEMRRAMADAELGDDVFREDPTVNRLQEVAAERLGKEAALFVSSGTMGNLLGVLVNARSGQEVIADSESHLFLNEGGGAAGLAGVQIRTLVTERGVLSTAQVEQAIRPTDDEHQPLTACVSVENTHNRHGGVTWPLEKLREVAGTAHRRGVSLHMDGARIFNAAIATGVPVAEIAAPADTVTFCLSKGLGCPIGSVFCGPQDKIEQARRWRKMIGGGTRQAGVLAAAGLYALDNMVDRLAEDHANARTLAEGLTEMDGVRCDLDRVETNIVFIELERMSAPHFVDECEKRGLRTDWSDQRVRLVTHFGIEADDVQQALKVVSEVVANGA